MSGAFSVFGVGFPKIEDEVRSCIRLATDFAYLAFHS